MKTSGVSSNPPVPGKSEGTSKTGQKDKAEKEFKEVLQESGGKAKLSKRKAHMPLGKKGTAGDGLIHSRLKSGGQNSSDPKSVEVGRIRLADKMTRQGEEDAELKINSKLKQRGEEEAPATVANPSGLPTPSLQSETDVGKVQNPGLNIDEIQSIVNKVQVGVNEKGLPECRFEIETKNLGTLDLKVNAEKDQIRIEFVTEDANAQQVLEHNLKELQQMLQDKGLTLVETKFTPRDQGDSQQQQESSGGDDEYYPPVPPSGPKRGFTL